MVRRVLTFFFLLLLTAFPAWSESNKPEDSLTYRTFFIPEEADTDLMIRELSRLKDSRILSPWTSVVEVADFTGLDMVLLEGLSGRLSPDDPRWTPYLRNVSRIFEAYSGGRKGWKLLIPEDTAADPGAGAVISEILDYTGGQEASLPGFTGLQPGPWSWVLSISVYAAWAVLWLLRQGKLKPFSLGLFFGGGVLAAFQVILLLPLMAFTAVLITGRDRIRAFHEKRSGDSPEEPGAYLFHGGVMAAGLVTLGLVGSLPPQWWAGTGVLALAAVLAGAGYWHYRAGEALKQEHRYFSPVEMKLPGARKAGRHLTLVLGLLPFLALLVQTPAVPSGETARFTGLPELTFSPETERMRRQEETSGLPGPASWLAHRIYQETFVFRKWEGDLSGPQEPVILPVYSRAGGRITESGETVLHLEETWLKDLKAGLPSHHSLRGTAAGGSAEGQAFPWPGMVSLGLLYFFLLLIRWVPAAGLKRVRLAFETRRDSLA